MKIDGSGSYYLMMANLTGNASNKTSDASGAFSTALSAASSSSATSSGATGNGVSSPGFSHITRKELADWVNSKIKSGQMSLDETEGFVGMTLHVPADGAYTGLDNSEQVNFAQLAQNGIEGARQNNDSVSLSMLQSALGTMLANQGRVTGVDISV